MGQVWQYRRISTREMAQRIYMALAVEEGTGSPDRADWFKEAVGLAEFFESAWGRYEQGLPIDAASLADDYLEVGDI